MLDRMFNYMEQGARLSAGFWPLSNDEILKAGLDPASPGMRYEQWGPHVFRNNAGGGVAERMKMPEATGARIGGAGAYAFAGLGLAASGYMVYSGFRDNGMAGAIEAAYTDVAIMSATNAALFPQQLSPVAKATVDKKAGIGGWLSKTSKVKSPGLFKAGSTMIGAAIGAGMGGGLGIPGTFVGAFLGGKLGSKPLIAMGAVAVGYAGSQIVKNGATVLRAGYHRERMRRRIDTAGSTASFMTQNAFTQRQRAMSAMQNSHLNARSALGMEATYMHMPRDYFSDYRRM